MHPRRLASAVATVLLVVLVGCSDEDGGEVATAPPVVTTTTGAATVTTVTGAGTAGCEAEVFTPNSEDAASGVVATGLTCPDAAALLRKVGPLVGATGGPAQITVAGFDCVRTRQDDGSYGLPSADYQCTSGARTVTFRRT